MSKKESTAVFCARAHIYILSALLALSAARAAAQAQAQAQAAGPKTKIEAIQDAIRRHDLSAVPDFKRETEASARAWIVRAVARLDPKGGLQTLEAALKDSNDEVRLAAAESLGQWGTAVAHADLAAALPGEKSAGVRQTMVFWLGASQHAIAADALSQAVAADGDANVRAEAAQALKRQGTLKAAKSLKKARKDTDERVRKIAN